MKSNERFFLAVVFIALAFTFFACTSDGGDDGGGITPDVSSSSGLPEYAYCVYISVQICLDGPFTACPDGAALSNSCPFQPSASSSSSSQQGVYYEGETYETVVIGDQTWLRRNLNYVPSTGNSWCYSGTDYSTGSGVSITAAEGCAKYGRLYDWAAAMDLPSSCNSSTCASLVSPKHQGICPSGWHIPSDADWTMLTNNIGGSSTAGTKLKATSGWNSGGNGTDTYGFAALPGGHGGSGGGFYDAGDYGYWCSSTEISANIAYYRGIYYTDEYVYRGNNYYKTFLFSVRCLKD
jgi:uncharacterized protein (TIGR02145 family)